MTFWSVKKIAAKVAEDDERKKMPPGKRCAETTHKSDTKKQKVADLKQEILANPGLLCGMDEVGRGPWAGPVVAAAFMMPVPLKLGGLRDSKQLSEEKREQFFWLFALKAWTGHGIADVPEIDELGLMAAIKLAYKRALENLLERNGGVAPAFLLIDGRDKLDLPYPSLSVIKGDEKIRHVAAASVVAKVARDRMMKEVAKKYPEYGFERHKGYGTEFHQKALRQYGACEIHRKSFEPVREMNFTKRKPRRRRGFSGMLSGGSTPPRSGFNSPLAPPLSALWSFEKGHSKRKPRFCGALLGMFTSRITTCILARMR